MPRGIYGKNRVSQSTCAAIIQPVATSAIVVGSTPGSSESNWKPAVIGIVALTGVIALGAATTSFSGRKRARARRSGSAYRAIY